MAWKLANKLFKGRSADHPYQEILKEVLSELTQIPKTNFGQLNYSAMEYIEKINSFYTTQKLGYNETLELI